MRNLGAGSFVTSYDVDALMDRIENAIRNSVCVVCASPDTPEPRKLYLHPKQAKRMKELSHRIMRLPVYVEKP